MTEWQFLRISARRVDSMLILLMLDAQVVYWREILYISLAAARVGNAPKYIDVW